MYPRYLSSALYVFNKISFYPLIKGNQLISLNFFRIPIKVSVLEIFLAIEQDILLSLPRASGFSSRANGNAKSATLLQSTYHCKKF